MVTFRNSLLLLAVIAMMVPAANAQVLPQPFKCVASAGVPPLIRAEGLAELTGDVLLTCTGGTPTLLGVDVPRINFRVFLNSNVTSRLLDGSWNEALLMVDDPQPGDQRLCDELSGCGDDFLGIGAEPGIDYSTAAYNVWQGTYVTGNTGGDGNTIDWLGVPIDPPGTQVIRTIRITNVRVNAAMKGVGGGLIPSDIIMFISATGPSGFPIDNPQQTVAFVQDGLTFSATNADFLQCEDPDDADNNPVTVTYKERFATAFKRRNVATEPDSPSSLANQNTPGNTLNTETGFYNSSFSSHGAGAAGLASQGTRLIAQFKAIPAGVHLWVSERNLSPYENYATLVTGASVTGAGGTPLNWSDADGEAEVTLVGGNGAATWEVTGDNPIANDEVMFSIRVDYTPNTTAGIPALGTGTVAGSYAPLSDLVTASSANLQPRFIDDSEDIEQLTINSCATNLLWPYVTNSAGFDTGLVISNTSMDPFGTATQAGACEIYYYGHAAGSDPPAMDTTPDVGAGGFAVWTLSSGGGVMHYAGIGEPGVIAAAPGFEGYVIAHCFFQYAHGYAFISDLGAQKLAQGYIALVLDESIWSGGVAGSRTGSKSEPLNQ